MNSFRDESDGFMARLRTGKLQIIPIPFRLIAGLSAYVLFGVILLSIPGVGAEHPLLFREVLFTAVSAITCTGLSVIVPAVDLSVFGQIILMFLIQIGGIGYMIFATMVFRLLGRRISMVDRIALRDALGMVRTGAILQFAEQVMLTVLAVEGVGALLLWLRWTPLMGPGRALWMAVFHAVSAFCNAGFDLFNGSKDLAGGIPNDGITLMVMGVLIFLGSIGFPVIANLIHLRRQKGLSLHTRLTLYLVGLLTIGGWAAFLLVEGGQGGTLHAEPFLQKVGISLYQVISTRTAGFAGYAGFQGVHSATRFLLIFLMFIGASPASMGGGMKTGAAISLLLVFWGYVRSETKTQIAGRSIPWETTRRAVAVLVASIVVVGLVTWLILLTHPADLELVLFEVVSAFATCGYTMSLTSQLNNFGLVLLMITMFWGKLGALTVAVALTRRRGSSPVTFPEEQILIG
jgi:trk system potassium uptake protein